MKVWSEYVLNDFAFNQPVGKLVSLSIRKQVHTLNTSISVAKTQFSIKFHIVSGGVQHIINVQSTE